MLLGAEVPQYGYPRMQAGLTQGYNTLANEVYFSAIGSILTMAWHRPRDTTS